MQLSPATFSSEQAQQYRNVAGVELRRGMTPLAVCSKAVNFMDRKRSRRRGSSSDRLQLMVNSISLPIVFFKITYVLSSHPKIKCSNVMKPHNHGWGKQFKITKIMGVNRNCLKMKNLSATKPHSFHHVAGAGCSLPVLFASFVATMAVAVKGETVNLNALRPGGLQPCCGQHVQAPRRCRH